MDLCGRRFPPPAARDIIAPLNLIDGDAVWTDQRDSSFPPVVPIAPGYLDTIGPQTATSKDIQGRLAKCEQFSPRRLIALAITTIGRTRR